MCHIEMCGVHLSELNIVAMDIDAFWICRIIRLYSCNAYLSLLLGFSIIMGFILVNAPVQSSVNWSRESLPIGIPENAHALLFC